MSELFVDPNVAGPGSGTIGDPHASIEYAITNNVLDLVNGTIIHVRDTVTDVLSADLSVSLASATPTAVWVPAVDAPVIIRGYTTAANDGGIGAIGGGGSVSIYTAVTQSFIAFKDMSLGDVGSNYILNINDSIVCDNVEFHTSSGNGVFVDVDYSFTGCYFRAIALTSFQGIGNGRFNGNFIDSAGTQCADFSGNDAWVSHNVFKQTSVGGRGVYLASETYFWNNVVWANGSTGNGVSTQIAKTGIVFFNNIIAGWSGAGAVGVDFSTAGTVVRLNANNTYYDNTTDESAAPTEWQVFGNETVLTDPFTDAVNNDFSTLDVGSIKEGGFPAVFGA